MSGLVWSVGHAAPPSARRRPQLGFSVQLGLACPQHPSKEVSRDEMQNHHSTRGSLLAVLALIGALVLTGCSSGSSYGGAFSFVSPGGQTELSYPLEQRQPIGALSGPDLVGDGTAAVSDYPGKVVVLNFWGSWCAPCRAEAGDLNTAAAALAGQGVQFLGVDIRDTRDGGRDFHSTFKVTYPSIFDPTMQTLLSLRGYPASAIPSTMVLDRTGRVAHIWLWRVTADDLITAISPIAAEAR
jgi:thiol-disulfide isomerase/thioredoxin